MFLNNVSSNFLSLLHDFLPDRVFVFGKERLDLGHDLLRIVEVDVVSARDGDQLEVGILGVDLQDVIVHSFPLVARALGGLHNQKWTLDASRKK